MRMQFLILIFLIFGLQSFAQKKDPQNIIIPTYEHCKEKWDYTFVKDTITGSVIYFEKAAVVMSDVLVIPC